MATGGRWTWAALKGRPEPYRTLHAKREMEKRKKGKPPVRNGGGIKYPNALLKGNE
jgi:hypothetical protein